MLPEDLPDAAEAALDDLLRANGGVDDDEPATYSRAVSEARVVDRRTDEDEPATVARERDPSGQRVAGPSYGADPRSIGGPGRRNDDTAAVTGKRRLPPPVAPLPSAAPVPRTASYGPLPSDSPLPSPTSRSTPLPSPNPLSSPIVRASPVPSRGNGAPERYTPTGSGRLSLPLPPIDTGAVPIVRPPPELGEDPNAIDTNAVPLIDTGLVPLTDDEDVDDLGMIARDEDDDLGMSGSADDEDIDDLGMTARADDEHDLGIRGDGGDEDDDVVGMRGDGGDEDDALGMHGSADEKNDGLGMRGHRADDGDMSSVIDSLEQTTSRADRMSNDRVMTRPGRPGSSYDDFAMPRAPSAPYDDIAFARAASAAQVYDEQLALAHAIIEVPSLRFAIYEESAHLGSAQSAVSAAGHSVTVAGAGRDAIAHVLDEIAEGEVDAVLAAMPGGEPILEAIATLADRPVVIASYGSTISDAIQRAIAAGADLATARPHDLERLAPILLAAARLQLERRVARAARGARTVDEARSFLALDAFQRTLDLEITRARRFEYPLSVALFTVEVDLPSPPPGIRGILRARAGNALMSTIRDIDLATQVEPSGTGPGSVQPGNERFLVLLPYTDLKGAAGVARRVIAAVTALDPVNAAGRSFAPRVVGALAGMRPGEPTTFDKLVKDATRTLEQARRDGAELAVQP